MGCEVQEPNTTDSPVSGDMPDRPSCYSHLDPANSDQTFDLKQLFLFDDGSKEEERSPFWRDVEALKQTPVFAGLSDKELLEERGLMDACRFAAGQVISCEDKEEERFHTIIDGQVEFVISDGKGGEVVVGEAGPGGFFGELSILCRESCGIKIRAKGEVSTLALDPNEFREFLDKHPSAAYDVLRDTAPRLAHIDKMLRETISRNAATEADSKLTFWQHLADKLAGTMGSWKFIITQATILAGWTVWNFIPGLPHFDPYPFIFMNLALSCQAAFAAPIIMMSQNRQSGRDRIAAQVDHEVNVKAELGVGAILKRLDDLQLQVQDLQSMGKAGH